MEWNHLQDSKEDSKVTIPSMHDVPQLQKLANIGGPFLDNRFMLYLWSFAPKPGKGSLNSIIDISFLFQGASFDL